MTFPFPPPPDDIHSDLDSPFGIELGSVVDDDLKSWVVLKVGTNEELGSVLLGFVKWRPNEARDFAVILLAAAEAVETRASLIMAMREQKVAEEAIQSVTERVEERRGR